MYAGICACAYAYIIFYEQFTVYFDFDVICFINVKLCKYVHTSIYSYVCVMHCACVLEKYLTSSNVNHKMKVIK